MHVTCYADGETARLKMGQRKIITGSTDGTQGVRRVSIHDALDYETFAAPVNSIIVILPKTAPHKCK